MPLTTPGARWCLVSVYLAAGVLPRVRDSFREATTVRLRVSKPAAVRGRVNDGRGRTVRYVNLGPLPRDDVWARRGGTVTRQLQKKGPATHRARLRFTGTGSFTIRRVRLAWSWDQHLECAGSREVSAGAPAAPAGMTVTLTEAPTRPPTTAGVAMRHCVRCRSLWWSGAAEGGVCAAGGTHQWNAPLDTPRLRSS